MSNTLKLVQTSPPSNPDRNIAAVTVIGNYINGTADNLPLSAISDPQILGQVPQPNPGQNPPPVSPKWFGFCAGYYAQVQRTVANGVTSFGLRWFSNQGAELGTGAYPAAITGGENFLEIQVNTQQNT
jgi:hypothetical protein